MPTMLDAALSYVEHGFKVFPVKVDKTPLTTHGLKDATQTHAGVREFWAKCPDAGIAISTEGLVVLDFDTKSGGLDSKPLLIAKFGAFPETRVHRTGGGGEHWLYSGYARNTVKLMGLSGVDVRGTGGYIVVPPSLHISGNHYSVISKHGIVPTPDWLVKLCQVSSSLPTTKQSSGGFTVYQLGERNSSLARLAGSFRHWGMAHTAILAALQEANRVQCVPPLPDKDVERIAGSISRYAPAVKSVAPKGGIPLVNLG